MAAYCSYPSVSVRIRVLKKVICVKENGKFLEHGTVVLGCRCRACNRENSTFPPFFSSDSFPPLKLRTRGRIRSYSYARIRVYGCFRFAGAGSGYGKFAAVRYEIVRKITTVRPGRTTNPENSPLPGVARAYQKKGSCR